MNNVTRQQHRLKWGKTKDRLPAKRVIRALCLIGEGDEIGTGSSAHDGFVDVHFLDLGVWKELESIYDPMCCCTDSDLRNRVYCFLADENFLITDRTEPHVIEEWELVGKVRDRRRRKDDME